MRFLLGEERAKLVDAYAQAATYLNDAISLIQLGKERLMPILILLPRVESRCKRIASAEK
jgi:hypothetical protein